MSCCVHLMLELYFLTFWIGSRLASPITDATKIYFMLGPYHKYDQGPQDFILLAIASAIVEKSLAPNLSYMD
jgi:hypothetical protein